MPKVWIEQGTVLNLRPPLGRAKRRIVRLYKNLGKDFFILSGNDSDHDMASMHFDDAAFDFAIHNVRVQDVVNAANNVGPEDKLADVKKYFDIIGYPSKGIFHIEYDPK